MDMRDEFYPKYRIIDRESGEEIDPSTCFTMVPAHDPHAVEALKVYADSVEEELPGLAGQIREQLVVPNG